ncbi:ankyrin-2-like isoform X3 [Limulus polyphemus]|uniref:Ankyrin-2-like isoform X3 n=1 Tax=Limulus polyphemus TaxID=6850 RepID=A0ABM1T169_LIMPO|nr:ankyrin-2-like isoform X3 [Limulus polyphemus]
MVTEDQRQADISASFLRAARAGNLEKVLEFLKGSIDINTSNANGLNALHLASKEGHVNIVSELLKRGANVNAATKKGNTALHIASLAGQEAVVKLLVQSGANVNVQSQNGFTPLYMAAQENHHSVVCFLLTSGANQSLATEDGFTPLAVSLQQGHDKVVTVLLENDAKGRVRLPALHIAAKKDDCKAAALLLQNDHNPDVTSKSGFTPLHIAAHYGNDNIGRLLLEKGAKVNYVAKHQITPLHVASKWGKSNMVILLIEKGAQIDALTKDGLTPLHCAARSGHDHVVDLLLERGAPVTAKTKNGLAPLHMASQADNVDCARTLLYHKAPVDDVTIDYLTALHVAAHCGHVKVAKILLDRKADPNARALNGFTPLHIACKKNRIKIVELLLKHGGSIEARTESGLTPLHVSAFMGNMNIVIFLIQHGADPDIPTVRGETPIHLAARANQADIIRILLRNGAHVDAKAREHQTPLHIAARLGNVDIVSLLIQHGAAVDATTKDMYTALHIAAKEGQEEVASLLLDNGASLTATTQKGFTSLHLTAKYGNIKVARILIQRNAPVDAQGKNGVTPLHVATHYDHVNVALLLLENGASPHAAAKNGYTSLHIAAKHSQMDIATTLLEYGAKANAETKTGFTPLHLASQEGHTDMTTLLTEHYADVNARAKNGLTPLHLCAQEDLVNIAAILVKNDATVDSETNAGYSPLHIACHFGQVNMVRFLLQHHTNVTSVNSHGYTPLHQAAQQGHALIINLLLEHKASPNVLTNEGQTALAIAKRLGYISVVETLKVVTENSIIPITTTVAEEKYKVVAPEIMQESFMSDSEDEGGEDTILGDQSMHYLTADEMKSLGDDSLPIDVTKDERTTDSMLLSADSGAPLTVEEDHLSPMHVSYNVETTYMDSYATDNIDMSRGPFHASKLKWKMFLVSFMVDARGGAMRGCRQSGVRVIIPPRKASMPMRITCRYLRKEKLIHPPPLMEGEACAARILEVGPVGAKFLGPIIIEIPHFTSLRGKEREIIILRSDNGEVWQEHTTEATEEAVQDTLNESFEGEEINALEDLNADCITRIVTTDFPQYFAIVSRVRQEVCNIGPEGGIVSSTVVPQVQAIFPEGALTKKIKVGLQAHPVVPELVSKMLGNRVGVSPIVTVEPRRRKFHKPITLTIPVPQTATKGMINQYSGNAPTLRLLCSISGSSKSGDLNMWTEQDRWSWSIEKVHNWLSSMYEYTFDLGGFTKAQWEDVTGSTPLTFVNDCVSFTTTVSARFWLMDCRHVNEVGNYATELYREVIYVPFMVKFVVFAKRYETMEAELRVFCMTDDKKEKTLETQENFTEIAKSRDVEVLEGKPQFLELAGNLVPVTKAGEHLTLNFQPFRENRLPFIVRVKDPDQDPIGRIAFMREPRVGRGEPPQTPICNLNIALPDICKIEKKPVTTEVVEKKYDFMEKTGPTKPEHIQHADLHLSDIAQGLDHDWVQLADQLDVPKSDVNNIKKEHPNDMTQQALVMLRLWIHRSYPKATGNSLEKALREINREDIVNRCMVNVKVVTDDVEKAVAKVHLDQSEIGEKTTNGFNCELIWREFDSFKDELGSSRDISLRHDTTHAMCYDEQDIMKEAESAEEISSKSGSAHENQLPVIVKKKQEEVDQQQHVPRKQIDKLLKDEVNVELSVKLTPQKVMEQEEKKNIIMKHSIKQDPLSKFPEIQKKGRGLERLGKDVEVEVERLFFEELEKPVSCLEEIKLIDEKRVPLERSGKQDLKIDEISQKWDKPKKPEEDLGEEELSLLKMQENLKEKTTKEDKFIHEYENFVEKFELEEKLEKLEKEEQTLKVEPKIKPQIELETLIKKTKLVEENTENNKFQELNKSNKIASEIESYKSAIQSQEFEEQKPKELLKTVITEVENVDALKLVVESFEEKNKMFEKLEVEVKSVNKPEQYIQTETVGEKMFEETLETKTKPVEIGKETTEQENKFKDLVQPKDILTEVKEKKLENKELTEKTLTYMCKFPVTKEENEEWKLKKELENSGTIKHVVKPTHEKTEVDDQVFMEVERAEKERSVYEIESVLENLNMEYSKEIKAVIESKDFIDINVKKQKFEDLERSKKTINLVKSEPLIQMSEIKKQSFEEIIKQELVKIPVEQKSPVESSESQDQLLEELENPEVICEHVIELKVEERTQKSFERPEIRSIVELVPVIEQPEVKKQILVESRRTTDNDFKVVIKTEDAVERPDVEDQKLEEVVMQMCKVKPVSEPVSIPDIRTFDSNSLITEQAEEKTFSLLDGPEKDLKLMPSDGPTTEELKAEPEQWTTTTSRQVASPSFPEDEQNELAIISMTTTPQNKPNTDLHTEEKEGTDTDESGAVQHVIQKQNSYVIKDENREHDSSVQHPTVTKGGTTFHVDLSFPTNPVYSYKIKQSPFSPSSPIPTTSCHVEQELSPAADYPVYLVPEMRVFVGISSKKSSDMNKYTFEDKKHVTRMEENISSESAYEFDPKNTNKQFTKICSSPFHNIYTEAQRIDYTCEDSVSKRCDTDVFTGNEEYVSSKVAQEESLNMHLPESSKAPEKDISYQETLNVYENTAFAGVDVIDKSAVEEENFERGTSSYEILRETNKELPTLNPATNAVGAMKVDQEIYSHFLEQSLHLPINEGLLFSKVTPETTTYVEHHIKSQIFSEELDQSIEENTPEKKDILEGKNIKPTKVERVDIVTKQIRSAILAHELSEDTENDLPEEKDIPYDQRKEKKLSHELYDDTESDIPEEKAFPFDQGKDKISERYKAEGYEDKIEREDKVALNEAINILKPDSETSLNYKGKTEELEKEFAKEIIGFSRTSDEEQETQCSSVEYAMLETPIQQNSEQIYEKVKELREKQIIIEHNEKKTLEESISENEQIWQDDKLKKKFSEDYVSEGISPSIKEEAVVAAKRIIEDIKTEVNLCQSLEHSLSEISDEDLTENLEEYIPIQQVEGRDKSEEKKVSFSEDMPEILQNTISENEQSYRENEEETVKIKEELILGSKTNDDGYNDIHFAETTCHEQQISEHHKKLTANANSETKEESVHISGEHKDKSFPVLSTDTASIKINEILIQKDNIEDHTSLSVVNEETKDDQILVSYNEQVCFTESNFSEKAVINMCKKKYLLNDMCESKRNTDSYDIDMTFSDETQAAEKETETTECLGDFLPETLQQIHETSDSAEKETIKLSGSSVITTQSFVKDIPHQKATIIHKISKDIHKYCEEVITSDKKQKFQCSDESSDLQEDTLTKGQTCFEITVKSDEEKTSESDKSEKLSSGCGVQVASSDPSSASRKEKHLDKNCETYSSSGETESHYYTFDMSDSGKTTQSTPATSRPCSSEFDVNIYVVPISSEYETCATSQEVSASYATAYTSQETSFATAHSSRSQSSLESTHSVDSESSGHLASVEMSSEASETLVPSAQELEQEFQRGTETPTLEDEEMISAFTPMEPYDSEIPETIIRRGVETPFLKEWKQSCDSSYSNMFGDKSQISEMEEVPSSPFEIITEEELADYPVDYLALVLQTDQFHNNKEGITCSTQAAKSKFKEHFQEEEVTKTRETNLESSGSELSATFVMESDTIQNTTTKYDEKTSTFSSNITDECYCSEKSAWKAKICKHESEVAASVEILLPI